MVDTGAAPNLIKGHKIKSHLPTETGHILRLSGITEGCVNTLGTVHVALNEHVVVMQVVPDDFPIPQDGILGAEFLRETAQIDFADQTVTWHGATYPFTQRETAKIPARTSSVLYVNIVNPETTIGYVPRIKTDHGVYLGDAVVSNRNGKAYLRAYNTNDKDVVIQIPHVWLEEIDDSSTQPRTGNASPLGYGTAEADSSPIRRESSVSPALGQEPAAENAGLHQINVISSIAKDRISRINEILRLEHLNREEAESIRQSIEKHEDLFHLPGDKLGYTRASKHKIVTTDNQPIHTKQYRFPPIHRDEIDKQVRQLLDNEVVKPSTSPYNSPLWIVPKKPDSKGNKRWRMVIDYRALNEKTIGDAYPLPNITEILDQLGSAKYFSVFDLASGFHQIPMDEGDAQKTAFSTPYGHYEFQRMPFGLKNAPATFQRLMDTVLTGLQGIELFVYLDDIVVYASSLREHELKIDKLAARLRQANLRLQPDKCEFLRREVVYLGHIIGEDGVKPDPSKIKAVKSFPTPKTATNIKQFLGLAGYYRRFIPQFSKIAKPLTTLLKKEVPFTWTTDQNEAFVNLKNQLCSVPLLQYPDFTKPFNVTTDASGIAVGGILSQGIVGKDLPVAYASRLLNKAEQNYSAIERELLAIVYCVNQFRPYLYGRKFHLITDHKPLVWLHSVKDPTSRLVRWRLKLAEYEYEVMYKAGKANSNADALSRNPVAERILPLSSDPDNSSSSLLFDPPLKSQPKLDEGVILQEIGNDSTNDDTKDGTNHSTDGSTDDDTSTETDEEPIFDNEDEPYEIRRASIIETRDNLAARNDNLVIFVTEAGDPCDEGAFILQKHGALPIIKDATVGRAKVLKNKTKRIIALVIKTRVSETTESQSVKEAICSLYDVVTELGLRTFSIAKSNVDHVHWNHTLNYIRQRFDCSETKIIVCTNQTQLPEKHARPQIIEENHSSAVGGHKGISKTYSRIKEHYFWPHMKEDIRRYIETCKNCQLKKLVRTKPRQPMTLTDTPGTAFDKVAMDIMGPLPITQKGNAYILTIQDLLTKYSLAIPLKEATAINIANAFINEFICSYGAPKAILTDQGSHFLNSLMRNIARRFKISHYHTTAYRPQSNGSIERSHHVLWEYLRQFVDKHSEWDEQLNLASLSYNTSVHEGTQYTPYELVFGKIARVPTSAPIPEAEGNETYTKYLTNLYERITETQRIARDNLTQAKERSKRYYDKKSRERSFKPGDTVYLLKEPNKSKLGNQYIGPFAIKEVLPNNNVELIINSHKTRKVHVDKIKLYKPAHASLTK